MKSAAKGRAGALLSALALLLVFGVAPAYAAGISVTTTADELNSDGDCSLREAITAANTDTATDACPAGFGADTIDIPAGTYNLTIAGSGEDGSATGDLDIAQSVTITGAGASTTIIDANDIDRVLHVFGGTVDLSGITIRNGFVDNAFGAGIHNSATLTLDEATVTGNVGVGGQTANPLGAGIFNGGTLVLTDTTVSGNSTGCCGGAVANLATLTIINSTLSGNSAGCCGGGIYNFGTLTLVNGTITANTSANGAGIFNGGTTTALNTIVANNVGAECNAGVPSAGNNLDSDSTCFSGGSDLHADPMLGPLADNGGPTKTHALPDGSPAIDTGTNTGCPATDQRGVARPQGSACDIGAFEFVPANTAPVALDGAYSTDEDTLLSVPAPGVLDNDEDAEGDALTAVLVGGPSNAASFALNADGSFDYTPAAEFSGTDSFTYKANDGEFDSNVATVTITVNAGNDPPTVEVVGTSCLSATAARAVLNLTLDDVDDDDATLIVSAASDNEALLPNGNLVVGGSGANRTLTLTAVSNMSGTATITIAVDDGDATTEVAVTVKVGAKGSDTLTGSAGPDVLFGLGGVDALNGDAGNDLLCGGQAVDTLNGGDGGDVLDGGQGNDNLNGGNGDDRLLGSGGNDTLTGGPEADFFSGGPGNDSTTDFNAAEGDTTDGT